MIHEIKSTRTHGRALTVESVETSPELLLSITKSGSEGGGGPEPEIMAQVRVARDEVTAALGVDARLAERLRKLADSWQFTRQTERTELLAALNPFEPQYRVGEVIRGRRPSDDTFTVFVYANGSWWEVGRDKQWFSRELLAQFTDLEVLREGYTIEDVESFTVADKGEQS